MFFTKLQSLLLFIIINLERIFEHTYRTFTGLPTFNRSMITPYLYLGGQYRASALDRLKKYGITAIVNMRRISISPRVSEKGFRTLHLPTPDLHAPTIENLQKGVAFIEKEIKKGGKVYIHCRLGEGRSPTMVIAYLMSTGITFEDAEKLVQSVRRFIRLSRPQRTILEKFTIPFKRIH